MDFDLDNKIFITKFLTKNMVGLKAVLLIIGPKDSFK